ncbi:hypothetical protein BT69DRAFT_1305930 [Atractiella rhizophila]|nr:hypothetical protein BT69DRAFT_1305930 [Atractiella rhizophila]
MPSKDGGDLPHRSPRKHAQKLESGKSQSNDENFMSRMDDEIIVYLIVPMLDFDLQHWGKSATKKNSMQPSTYSHSWDFGTYMKKTMYRAIGNFLVFYTFLCKEHPEEQRFEWERHDLSTGTIQKYGEQFHGMSKSAREQVSKGETSDSDGQQRKGALATSLTPDRRALLRPAFISCFKRPVTKKSSVDGVKTSFALDEAALEDQDHEINESGLADIFDKAQAGDAAIMAIDNQVMATEYSAKQEPTSLDQVTNLAKKVEESPVICTSLRPKTCKHSPSTSSRKSTSLKLEKCRLTGIEWSILDELVPSFDFFIQIEGWLI